MFEKGSKVHYIIHSNCLIDDIENGIVKSMSDNGSHAFVVFNCDNDWDNFENYTGQSTNILKLKKGWFGFDPLLFKFERNDIYSFRKSDEYIIQNLNFNRFAIIKKNVSIPNQTLYVGKINNNSFALELFLNIGGILSDEEIININRELSIDNLIY